MSLDEFLEEHKRLTDLLKTCVSGLQDELINQTKEMNRYMLKNSKSKRGGGIGSNKIRIVMREFKNGILRSKSGKIVKNPKQAIAIALSEQKRYDMDKIRKSKKMQ